MNANILHKDQIEELEIDLTGTCNLMCPICTRNFVHAKHMIIKNIRPFLEIKQQLDSFKGLKRLFIAGAVSEPTLYPQFFEFIKYLNFRNITFELFTNGNTHDIQWWKNLGEIVPYNSITCFTICGSTQELHAKYRIGSNLKQILDNASAYRTNNKRNDWIQTIRFEYNKTDLNSNNMYDIINKFSHHIQVDSEGIRRLNDKIHKHDIEINPIKKRLAAIKYIFNKMPPKKTAIQIQCKSFMHKKLYIDQFGNIYPCYINAEFEKHIIDEKSNIFDYSKIFAYEYQDCYLCSSYVNDMIKRMKLEFIC